MTFVAHTCQVDVRGSALPQRRSSILLAYRQLQVGDTMEVVDRQDPVDLYGALNAIAPGDFSWLYHERGPDVWSVSVRKLGRIYSAGECCGVCGGTHGATTTNQDGSNP